MFGSSSSEPAGMSNTFPDLFKKGKPEPQFEQNTFVKVLSGSSKRLTLSEPVIQFTLVGVVRIFEANAEPVIFRHCSQ